MLGAEQKRGLPQPDFSPYEPQTDVNVIKQKLQDALAKPEAELTSKDFFEVVADIAVAFGEGEEVSYKGKSIRRRRAAIGEYGKGGYHLYYSHESKSTQKIPLQRASFAYELPFYDYYDRGPTDNPVGTTHALAFKQLLDGSIQATHYTSETEKAYPLIPEHERHHLKSLLNNLQPQQGQNSSNQ